MLRTLLIAFACLAFGCTSQSEQTPVLTDIDQSQQTPVLTDMAQLNTYVGQVVTIRGEVTYTKIPTIIGVDVRSFDPDLRGQQAEATGVLQRNVVTPEQIARANFANRGPGVFYRLKDIDTNYEAAVRPVSP